MLTLNSSWLNIDYHCVKNIDYQKEYTPNLWCWEVHPVAQRSTVLPAFIWFSFYLLCSPSIKAIRTNYSIIFFLFKAYSSNSSFSLFFQHIQNKGYRIRIQLCLYFIACKQPCHVHTILFPIEAAARFRNKGCVRPCHWSFGGIARTARA